MTNQKNRWKTMAVPLAVIFFFALLGGFIFFRHSEPSSSTDYEQKQALEAQEATPEKLFVTAIQDNQSPINPLRTDQKAIEAGQKHFRVICAKCHRNDAKGDVGPNLTDDTWLHGSSDREVYLVIMEGVSRNDTLQKPFRGIMPPYSSMLGVRKVLEVMAWLGSQNPSWSGKAGAAQESAR